MSVFSSTFKEPFHNPFGSPFNDPGVGGGGSPDPNAAILALFGAGEKGLTLKPGDLSTLWQGPGRTNPVTTVGQTIAVADDISGNGLHVTFSNAVLGQDGGGRYRIEFNGSSTSGATASFAAVSDKCLIIAGVQSNLVYSQTIARFGNVTPDAGSFDFGIYGSAGLITYRKGSGSFGARTTTASVGTGLNVLTSQLNLAGNSQATENPDVRVNGAQSGAITDYGAADSGGGNFGTYTVTIGIGAGFFDGGLYSLTVRFASTMASLPMIEEAERWHALETGATLPFDAAPVFWDTGAEIQRGQYIETSTFSRAVFQTDATLLNFSAYCTVFGNYPEYSEIGVLVDGVYHQSVPATANGANAMSVTLPAGSKQVSFVAGLQSRPNGGAPPIGTWFNKITGGNGPVTQILPAARPRVLFYGDSITVGGNAPPATQLGYPALVRAAIYPKSVALEAWGYRSLGEDCPDATARNAFIAKLVAYAPQVIWLAIGTNDYGINGSTPANFGANYAAVLDGLHAALPSCVIFAQTPLSRGSEGPNVYGATLGDYRAQIEATVSTRTSFTTLVDGPSIMPTSDMPDGVHPNAAGHAKQAAAVLARLGSLP